MTQKEREKLLKRVTWAAIGASGLLVSVKFYAWICTGAVSIQATLVDSFLDVVASTINFFAVRHSLKPADHEHRFGHGKIEALVGLAQAAFIAGSAALIFLEAGRRLIQPIPLVHHASGVWVILFSIAVTFLLVRYQNRIVKQTGSTAIHADAMHYRSDLLINAGVLISLFLGQWLHIDRIDPVFGSVIAVYILWTTLGIFKSSLDVLMDRELPDTERERIAALVISHPRIKGFHDLRTRSTGSQKFIQLHIEIDPNILFQEAYDIAHEVEALIEAAYDNAEVIIHQDVPRT